MTYCFCGCAKRITNPRLVVTNTNGWELSEELAQWTKLQIFFKRASLDLSDQLKRDLADGQLLWKDLVEAVHSGERADKEIEARAVVWAKHARKDRKKLRKRYRKEGMVDPFELADLEAAQLTAWITRGQEPPWAIELDATEADQQDGEYEYVDPEQAAARLLDEALDLEIASDWEWSPLAGAALVATANQLAGDRVDYNLVLDAVSFGFCVRQSERDVFETVNSPDPAYVEQITEAFAEDPVKTLELTMSQIAIGLPAAFASGPDVWNEVLEQARDILVERAKVILPQIDDYYDVEGPASKDYIDLVNRQLAERAEWHAQSRDFAFGLGYGLAAATEVLPIEATRESEPLG